MQRVDIYIYQRFIGILSFIVIKPHSSGNLFHNSYVNNAIFGHIPSFFLCMIYVC